MKTVLKTDDSMLIHSTSSYRVERDRMGHFLIIRLDDVSSVYLQGDDAFLFANKLDSITANNAYDSWFDLHCSDYDDVME